jgi:hypothetical protein
MHTVTFDVPDSVQLYAPTDLAKNCPEEEVLITYRPTSRGLTLRWDGERISFSLCNVTVSYRLAFIHGCNIDRSRHNSYWHHCELLLGIRGGSMPIIYTQKADEQDFDNLIQQFRAAHLPIEISSDPPKYWRPSPQ